MIHAFTGISAHLERKSAHEIKYLWSHNRDPYLDLYNSKTSDPGHTGFHHPPSNVQRASSFTPTGWASPAYQDDPRQDSPTTKKYNPSIHHGQVLKSGWSGNERLP